MIDFDKQNEHRRIDQMLAGGKIDVDEAGRLRGAIDRSEQKVSSEIDRPRFSFLALFGGLGVPIGIVVGLMVCGVAIAFGVRGSDPVGGGAFVGGVVALCLWAISIVAFCQIKRYPDQLCGRRMATVGIVLPILLLIGIGGVGYYWYLESRQRCESALRVACFQAVAQNFLCTIKEGRSYVEVFNKALSISQSQCKRVEDEIKQVKLRLKTKKADDNDQADAILLEDLQKEHKRIKAQLRAKEEEVVRVLKPLRKIQLLALYELSPEGCISGWSKGDPLPPRVIEYAEKIFPEKQCDYASVIDTIERIGDDMGHFETETFLDIGNKQVYLRVHDNRIALESIVVDSKQAVDVKAP